ncbi:melanoma antigen recognized by T-cells 1 [Pseudophryne corroboree]|uniref:melanoma antigen recognized by T-cells 1 n=1 Tax=Pseudophryne corroboree TaxID=495146 RepID=UPI003081EFC5
MVMREKQPLHSHTREPSIASKSWLCEFGKKMPRSGSSHTLGADSRGRPTYGLSSEGTAGIVVLAVLAALILIIGCWYFKKRSGYKVVGSRYLNPFAIQSMFGTSRETGECKVPLQDYSTLTNMIPGAPPAYEKISAETRPPPYTP